MKKFFKALINLLKSLFGKNDSSNPSVEILYTYGGFNFSKAKEDSSQVIQNLKVTSNRMSYSWKSTGKLWGLEDTDASAIAVFAVKGSDGVYRGGKFEWISKSRTTRSFTNIKEGYNGWPKDAVETAKGYAFCIVKKDGSLRTNWIFS